MEEIIVIVLRGEIAHAKRLGAVLLLIGLDSSIVAIVVSFGKTSVIVLFGWSGRVVLLNNRFGHQRSEEHTSELQYSGESRMPSSA